MGKRRKLKVGEQPQGTISAQVAKGTQICVLAGPRSWTIENWIIDICEASGQKVDWCFQGGRAFVMALGDISKVKTVMVQKLGELNENYHKEQKNQRWKDDVQLHWYI